MLGREYKGHTFKADAHLKVDLVQPMDGEIKKERLLNFSFYAQTRVSEILSSCFEIPRLNGMLMSTFLSSIP